MKIVNTEHPLFQGDFLYYNPTLAQYKLQGRSMEIGLARYVQKMGGER